MLWLQFRVSCSEFVGRPVEEPLDACMWGRDKMRHFILNVFLSGYKFRGALLTDCTAVGRWANPLFAVAPGRRISAWGIAMYIMWHLVEFVQFWESTRVTTAVYPRSAPKIWARIMILKFWLYLSVLIVKEAEWQLMFPLSCAHARPRNGCRTPAHE
jgi:hypothetical protein